MRLPVDGSDEVYRIAPQKDGDRVGISGRYQLFRAVVHDALHATLCNGAGGDVNLLVLLCAAGDIELIVSHVKCASAEEDLDAVHVRARHDRGGFDAQYDALDTDGHRLLLARVQV